MISSDLRGEFLNFFEKRGHKIISSSSLLSNDSTVLFTTAGMQQFKPYFTGDFSAEKNLGSHRVTSVQKCVRTSDIEKVGDSSHLTFFEMLGNFSFGPVKKDEPTDFSREGYFKKAAIYWAYQFLTEVLSINSQRIKVSIFDPSRDKNKISELELDKESYEIWKNEIGLGEKQIFFQGSEDNFWGPTGQEGPCGPTTEIYIDNLEVWNLVFNQYYAKKNNQGEIISLKKLKSSGVDTGMGLERLLMVMNRKNNVYETDIFQPLMEKMANINIPLKVKRIISDHLKTIVFLVSEGLSPSNKEAGYILRRLIRKIAVYQFKFKFSIDLFFSLAEVIKMKYVSFYKELDKFNFEIIRQEIEKFNYSLNKGLKEAKKMDFIDSQKAFYLYESFGFHPEILPIFFEDKLKNFSQKDFEKEISKHQEISRAGQKKKFGGHGLKESGKIEGVGEEEKLKIIKLHTATHLLHQALFDVLGNKIKQLGSDITSERLRFDFPFERKLTEEEIKKIEDIVNQKIKENLPVHFEEKPLTEAIREGAKAFFKAKYPPIVKVYYIGNYSKEICNGPHVESTGKMGKFKIIKEKGIGQGVRRIKAILE